MNYIFQIQDKSDEENCDKVDVVASYQRHIPPPKENDTKFAVFVSIDLLDIQEIDETNSKFTVPFHLHLRWIDARLTYKSLKTNKVLNQLTIDEIAQIWEPRVVFKNTNTKEKTISPTKDVDGEDLATIQVEKNY